MKTPRFLQIALLILLAAGAQPAYSALWQWSKTSSTNASIDPSINWAEGMSPSSINDSARAMMARISEYRDDISGLLATGGTSTAYTVSTNQGLCQSPASTTTPIDGQQLSVTVNSTNGTAPTLQSDSCSAFPIQSSAGNAVASGTLISGSPYSMRFSAANSAWMLKGFYASATNVALGMMVPYTLTTVPNSNFVFPAGQCLSTITYASYWNALGSPGPGSCGVNQFQIVDMSGTVAAGLDTMPGFSAANRLTSAAGGCGTAMTSVGTRCANGSQSHTLLTGEIPSHQHNVFLKDPGHVHATTLLVFTGFAGGGSQAVGTGGSLSTLSAVTNMTVGSVNGVANDNQTATAGGGGAHSIVMPTVGVTYLLRVL